MKVPLFSLERQHAALCEDLVESSRRVIESGQFVLGREVANLEAAIAKDCGVEHAIGMSSGSDALIAALMAAGIGPGDEVLCPAFSFFATASCITRLGAKPVWVDIREDDFNLDPSDAKRKWSEACRAVLPVHLYGQIGAIEELCEWAKSNNVTVIEDGAQALRAEAGGQPTGRFGRMATISFYPTKNLGALGDAGMVVTDDGELAHQLRRIRNHGMEPRYYHQM